MHSVFRKLELTIVQDLVDRQCSMISLRLMDTSSVMQQDTNGPPLRPLQTSCNVVRKSFSRYRFWIWRHEGHELDLVLRFLAICTIAKGWLGVRHTVQIVAKNSCPQFVLVYMRDWGLLKE